MTINSTKIDGANAKISAVITADVLNQKIEKVVKDLSKQVKIDGFRKGKVPVTLVKARYGDKINEDARNEAAHEAWISGVKELAIDEKNLIGNPVVTKFDINGDEIAMEVEFSFRPEMNLDGYEALVPSFDQPTVTAEEVNERIQGLAKSSSVPEKITTARSLVKGDTAVFDFAGSLEGVELPEATAQGYSLEIGSNQFVPGFEDQMVGMNEGESKEITVTFPEDYHGEKLAGKAVTFKITLNDILERGEVVVDDELAKRIMTGNDNASLEELTKVVTETMINEKKARLFNDELKPVLMNALVEKFDFALPKTVVMQEVELMLKNKLYAMNPEEIEELKNDATKVEALRAELEPEARQSVKATFLVDELARKMGIEVEDRELVNAIYYEALMQRQDPKTMMEYYKNNGLLPALKMAMIEDKLLARLLDGNKE